MKELKKVKRRIIWFQKKIKRWNQAYYLDQDPVVSDEIYDACYRELKTLEKKYPEFSTTTSPTKVVGALTRDKGVFQKKKHFWKMLSLENAFNFEEVKLFFERVKKKVNRVKNNSDLPVYFCELKIDGVSISLSYHNGSLVQALTRGNGKVGEDVTANVLMINEIPKSISFLGKLEVRGEIFITKNEFTRINHENLRLKEKLFSNPRNLASGSLRQIDPEVTSRRALNSFFYQVLFHENKFLDIYKTQEHALVFLKEQGFCVNEFFGVCQTSEDVFTYINKMIYKKDNFPYHVDGVVIKVNDFSLYRVLGETTNVYKWALAYKFESETKITTLKGIKQTVGRTGRINYVASLRTVLLDNTKVSAASLNNYKYILEKDFRIGCHVFVKKAGSIIPQVLSAVKDDFFFQLQQWKVPLFCAFCSSHLFFSLTEKQQFCRNLNCSEQLFWRIVHFTSRNAMNIEFLGKNTILTFLRKKIISKIEEIFLLRERKNEILKLAGFKQKKIIRLLESIEEAKKNRTFGNFIFALGIPQVGVRNANLISKMISSVDELQKLKPEKLNEVVGFGEKIVSEIISFLKVNSHFIEFFKSSDFYFKITSSQGGSYLFSVVLTGRFKVTRKIFSEILEKNRIKVLNHVSQKIKFLIVGLEPSPQKVNFSQNNNIEILSEKNFLDFLKLNKIKVI